MKLAKATLFFFLLVNFAYSSINEYFPTLAEYKLLGDRAYNQAIKQPSIKPKYDEGAASVDGLINYLQSSLRHDDIDEEELKEKFDLLKKKLIPLSDALNDKPKANLELHKHAQVSMGELAMVNIEDPLGLKVLWKEIFNYFNKLHGEKIRANEEDVRQLNRYKWKK